MQQRRLTSFFVSLSIFLRNSSNLWENGPWPVTVTKSKIKFMLIHNSRPITQGRGGGGGGLVFWEQKYFN